MRFCGSTSLRCYLTVHSIVLIEKALVRFYISAIIGLVIKRGVVFMIQEFEDHLLELRHLYKEATFKQRYHVACQRIETPDCWPNQLCNHVSALEGVARALAMDYLIKTGSGLDEAYAQVAYKPVTQIIEQVICRKAKKTPQELLRDRWEDLQYAEKYRNLLIHESTFLRQDYAARLVDACKEVMKILSEMGE